ncbi:adenylate cyclase [Paraburkholderia sp. BL6669N2]|nr:adenylate cyclase [Paraburkholderia sp. BL6669N2]
MNRTRIAAWKPLYSADMLRAAGRAPIAPFRRPPGMVARVAREPAVHTLLRRCQLVSGVVLLVYLSLHLINHALGIWSLDLAGRGLALALRVWRSVPGTVLLYGASLLHFSLALRTIYGRRHWKMPLTEWVRLWAGLSLPLLLIRHVVSTRLASSLYGFEPNYERIVISLITSGTQGLQLALLAPGWVHGCLGLWLRMRHRAGARRAKPYLMGLLVGLPMLSAAGFVRMKQAVLALCIGPLRTDPKLVAHQLSLDAWRHNILMLYLSLLIGAFVAGQIRNWREHRQLRKATMTV